MNATDLTPTLDEADRLAKVDELVDADLSRERSERIIARLFEVINGPWTETVLSVKQKPDEVDPETAFIQGCFIAYLNCWVEERTLTAMLSQTLALTMLTAEDAGKKGSN